MNVQGFEHIIRENELLAAYMVSHWRPGAVFRGANQCR